ncbi:hypothetical protein [Flavobacterium sp. XGLA_31]|uniref:hypothetical protein n=1 Tax=Flavobacterium sp. XGLA_31 TaxID=3447666 RepID=UPI003F3550EE
MRYFFSIVLLIFIPHLLLAQQGSTKEIKGKVVSEAPDLENIYVVNLKSEATTSTRNGGYFTIAAAVGDTLMFSAVQIKGSRMVITEKDLGKDLILVKLEPVINQLHEVIIQQYKNINAVSLGIIPANTKRYTPAERKLKTATDADPKGNFDGSLGGSVGLDPVLNWISGRTAMLKKELEVEKKELLLQKLENQFSANYFTDKLKIPKDYVKGFWYFAIEEPKLVKALNEKNETMAAFVLAELATKYIELQKPESR